MDLAIKSYQEIKDVLLKLDEVRFAANKLMGPQGILAQNERKMYLNENLAEHDQLVNNLSASKPPIPQQQI